ncbi:extracellular solute-binding protein [Streptomyces sp. CB01881]|uniref:extracellular solute-binding protein n=1 Tax=Streptomyces sp. CB01881 TaxID=2078691 RepID=UPI000CDBC941|nr:extracellular solute-binding protein [Streptomyces sp. CB01881]AUY49882.1 sugar transporter [Streptomyces sp. CB01881]TYC73275.1 extracellular solute-binding protein [Streptomyces sp. CB01881]
MKRQLIAAVGVAAMVVGLAACGSDGKKDNDASGSTSAAAKDYNGKTLTVWLMDGSAPKGWEDSVKADFATAYPGAKLDIQTQKWNGIGQKVTAALSEGSVDVLEIGNTQTSGYAATGGLLDITKDKNDLGGADWAANLNESSIFEGKQYAAPWYFTNRVVTYNKDVWTKAGITTPPKTLDEFYADLDKVKAVAGVKDALYMPGQEWYAYFGLLTSEGGKLAKKDGDKWAGGLSSPEAQKAFETYKKLQSYSATAPKDKDEATPQQKDVFAKGDIGTIIGLGWELPKPEELAPEKIGFFPLPGKTADKPSGVFLGGSNLAIAQQSKNPELAKGFLKIAMNEKNEGLVASSGSIPNKTALNSKVTGDFAKAALPASANGAVTPNVPTWTNVENEPNPIKDFLTSALTGDYAAAAKKADDEIAKRLNQKQ